jgi:hypothetical protein
MQTHAPRPKPRQASPAAPRSSAPTPAARDLPPTPGFVTPATLERMQASAGNRAATALVAQRATPGGPTVQRAIGTEQAEAIARQLEDAMSGWGTDEEAIYGALAGRTGTDMTKIRSAYRRVFDADLDADLEDELTDSELAKVRQMMPPTADELTLSDEEKSTAATNRARVVAQQIKDAIDGLGTEEAQIYNSLTGRTSAELNDIAAQYLDLTGRDVILDLRGDMSGGELRRALNLFEVAAAGTFENEFEQNMTEGKSTFGHGYYNYTLHTDRLEIDVPVKFKPDEGVTAPFALWNQQIDDVWNQFALTEPGGRKLPINLTMRNDSGADREVIVHKNSDPDNPLKDRANAGEFYLVMADDTVPHEFGHFIGLEDEYQRYHPDFKRIVGMPPMGPENESGQTVEEIAADLHGALHISVVKDRTDAAMGVLRNVGLFTGTDDRPEQGTFAQGVRIAYDEAYSNTLVEDMRDQLTKESDTVDPNRGFKKWKIQTVFSFASRSVMGNPEALGGVQPHDHAVEPRHLRRFADLAKATWPEFQWTVGPR